MLTIAWLIHCAINWCEEQIETAWQRWRTRNWTV